MMEQEIKPPTLGVGPEVSTHRPCKRVKAAYRRAFFVLNRAFKADKLQGLGNQKWLQKAETPSFRAFYLSQLETDPDCKAYATNKALAQESPTKFRQRNSLPAKPKMLRTRRRGKKIGVNR